MSSLIMDLADAIEDAIAISWEPVAPDTVEAGFHFAFELDSMEGRQVRILPAAYGFPEPVSRAQDVAELAVTVVVAERYPDAGPVPQAWLRERVAFVEEHVVGLDDSRTAELPGGYYAWSSEVDPVYDLDELTQRNLFLSVVKLTMRREV